VERPEDPDDIEIEDKPGEGARLLSKLTEELATHL